MCARVTRPVTVTSHIARSRLAVTSALPNGHVTPPVTGHGSRHGSRHGSCHGSCHGPCHGSCHAPSTAAGAAVTPPSPRPLQIPVKVYARCLRSDIEYKTLSVTFDTTCRQLVSTLLNKYRMKHRDPNLFFLTMEVGVRSAGELGGGTEREGWKEEGGGWE